MAPTPPPSAAQRRMQQEHDVIMGLREEVRKDISLAIANFKVWLLVTVLSNVVLVGAPAFYVFISTSSVAESAFAIGTTNSKRIESQRLTDLEHDARISDIEKLLADRYKFERRERFSQEPY